MNLMELSQYRKIAVVGSPGAGKSYFSKQLAAWLGLPLYHLDNYWHLPGWLTIPKEEFIARQREMIQADAWIIDGNYGETIELRIASAQLVVFLDINRFVCLWSAVRRTGKKRDDLPEYLEEPKWFSREFAEFAKFIWQYPKSGRKKVLTLCEKYPTATLWRVHSRRELRRTLVR